MLVLVRVCGRSNVRSECARFDRWYCITIRGLSRFGSARVANRCIAIRSAIDGSKVDSWRNNHRKKTPPLTNIQFSPVVDAVVPSQIQIQDLPSDAKKLAPQLGGYGCIVFEELIAIVDQNTRKIAFVIPRWRQQ